MVYGKEVCGTRSQELCGDLDSGLKRKKVGPRTVYLYLCYKASNSDTLTCVVFIFKVEAK